ncbi:uncharacterized protein MYCFIDRAFT_30655 [Pseudocercospora fijiensis CIRAD86]|uniref:Uncharacterized protein n=1 Tax=Pseudocercospora fijiensis (strain CIRAD86) TaxID=383855 RepID=M3BCQ2_PSEFD|nr:uncharacterized protein MYCFIDRAFT_30655 [Pseudocercospora fijiensis CIRAD86]EME87057.1 hypothetical protein MYCFIDRAFT_30655 [Pseudocercospora fijiensis CIRAD86]
MTLRCSHLRARPVFRIDLSAALFDETGGFLNHIPRPTALRLNSSTYNAKTPSGQNYTSESDRLGGRLPIWLISPWVQKGYVEQRGTNSDGSTASYSASSMLRRLRYLWGFDPINPRVEKAATFDALIQKNVRTDAPTKLPDVVKFTDQLE